MGDVVQSIVDKVDSTLQIASPSKVMIDRGKQVVAGLVKGISDAAGSIQTTMTPMLQGEILTPSMPAAMPSGGSSVVNTIQIGDIIMRDDGMSAAQVQQLILRTVSGAIG